MASLSLLSHLLSATKQKLMMLMQNHYTVLEVPYTATSQEIKASYRKLALQWHPDRNGDNPGAKERFQQINSAFEVLGDSAKKRDYDLMFSIHQLNQQKLSLPKHQKLFERRKKPTKATKAPDLSKLTKEELIVAALLMILFK
jgi:DnaJ-class molecular chaperone